MLCQNGVGLSPAERFWYDSRGTNALERLLLTFDTLLHPISSSSTTHPQSSPSASPTNLSSSSSSHDVSSPASSSSSSDNSRLHHNQHPHQLAAILASVCEGITTLLMYGFRLSSVHELSQRGVTARTLQRIGAAWSDERVKMARFNGRLRRQVVTMHKLELNYFRIVLLSMKLVKIQKI